MEDHVEATKTFRLFKEGKEVRFEVMSEYHWKVTHASEGTGSKVGDEVSPVERRSWREAKRRVNSRRSALSPNRLVLLRGEGYERSDQEVAGLLRTRPWDPDFPPAA
jgi:hypothetical protein